MGAYELFRDAIFGNPPSPTTKPSREGVLAGFGMLANSIELAIAALIADNALVLYAARSSLYGNLAPADRTLGIVYNDGANNGVYIKNGATGSGSWVATGLMGTGPAGVNATVGVGTVSSGTAPAVTNSGTSSAAILNFVLQKGDSGKSFLQTAIDSGYVAPGTTEAQLISKIVGQITAAAMTARDQAGASAATSTLQALRAEAAAATAAAAQQAVLDNIAGIDVSVGLQLQAVSVAALRAITDRPVGRQAYLSETGRAGTFVWSSADLSAVCAIDAQMGVYIPPTGQNGSAGAWVRIVNPGQRWHGSWFALPNAISADDSDVIRAIEALRPSGTDVKFAPGSHKVGNVKITKPGHWGGSGKLTVIQHSGTSNVDTFGICTQGGTRFSHMRFTGLVTADNANARFPLYVCARPNETDYPQDSEDHEFDHLWFDGCSTGIRVSYGAAMVNGSPVFFTPNRTSIHHCVFSCTYQDVIPESRDIHIYKNSFLRPDTSDNARPFAHCLRILGCNRVTIEDNYFELPINFVGVAFMLAGVDDGTQPIRSAYRTANDVTYRNNRTVGGLGLQVRTPSGVLRITGNKHWRDPTRTDLQPWIGIYDATPAFFGSIIVQDNHVVGFTTPYFVENTSIHHFRSRGNTFVGNAYAGGVFDAAALLISIAGNDQAGNPLMAPKLIEIIDDTFILSESACIPIVFRGGTAAQWVQTRIIVRGAALPYSPQPNYQIMQRGGGDGDPLVYLGFGTGLARFSTLDPTAMRVSAGDNIRLDVDAWSQFRTNMDRPETIMGPFPPVWP